MAGDLYEQGYYSSGSASITQGQTVVTGQGTAWSQIVRPADDFGKHVGMPVPIASVDSDTQITLAYPWPGPTQAAAPYRVTFTPYHVAYRQALQEIGQLLESGNVSALAGLTGAANRIPLFTGPGAMGLIAKEDLINGVRFDVQVPDVASRAAYDNEAAGFTVLVADVGDGRSAIYTKSSVAAADWSAPAYLTGPKGDTGSPWDDWRGAWVTATAYAELAGVENGGSSYICTTAHTSDAASEPGAGASWQTYWDLVAAKGADGLGTGDVVGPASATDNNVALFDGPTGKLIKEGGALGTAAFSTAGDFATAAQGIKADNAQPALGYTPANKAGDVFSGHVYFGGIGTDGKTFYRNNADILVAEVGVRVGTGYPDSLGFYNHTGTGIWWIGGNVTVTGALSKGSGTFLIDHPLDPANRDLAHGFVEAPRYDLIYRGTVALVDGRATVDIDAASNMSPGTFEALTTNAVVTSLQNQSGFARLRPGAIAGGSFEIICEDDTCTDTVSWVIIAERNDAFVKHMDDNCDPAGRFIPEREKPE